MNTYIILRREGWTTGAELEAAAARSTQVGAEMAGDISWIRSYVVAEKDGSLGTVCVYQATSEEKVREHAECAGIPVDELICVADLIVIKPDPAATDSTE